ncbi:hypothetical protein [Paracoccus aerius]|uniref:Uncharacterized protein n=1 Tax=Paracoccus aerius TaxID=1915382 RepID=A0ABS1S6B3_9RHOB|nr:hypothetical protein [Paracoccus aerius]MBL3674266.1 hypothetical protein [Paracoccus aerius]GHG24471.1 hypothetical protein GCM10017322_23050 [Paracoccus aerius]
MADRINTGCIVQVWFEPESDHKRAPFSMIETELPDFATFCELVHADRLIGGAVLWTRRSKDGDQIIKDRQPIAFRGSAVLRCQLPRWRFIEEGQEDG